MEALEKTHTPDQLADLKEKIIGRLRTIYDPEIPVNVYDLGLIYKIEAFPSEQDSLIDLSISMTLTAPGCPIADEIVEMVRSTLDEMEQVNAVKVELVWDPPWDKTMMTDEAKLALNILD